ncbi:unnamed protein product [Orchesella dallaii]|uniref:F-box domain-containing protein n=1 Tax=Orchesella dallaii TaxID=48710 RepID=A0ABP1QDA9_9HEXA
MECLNTLKRGTPLRSPTTTPVLPPEIWKHIFQFVGPDDLLSVVLTCPEWDELLDGTKTTMLLPQVIPSLMEYIDRNTILKLRMITNSTKRAVDETLQSFYDSDDEGPSNINFEETSSQQHLRKVADGISNRYSFFYPEFGYFLAQLFSSLPVLSSEVNPFLIRHITYVNYICDFSSRNICCMHRSLLRFCHHLLSLKCTVMGDPRILSYDRIVDQWGLVPNLKRLAITYEGMITSQTLNPDLPQGLVVCNFPTLSQLVRLTIEFRIENVGLSKFVVSLVRHYSPQLTSFTCHATLLALPDFTVDMLNTKFLNIKKFHLVVEAPEHRHVVTALEKLSNVSWSLESLRIQVHFGDDINAQLILSTINNFRSSLAYLELDCNKVPDEPNVNESNIYEEELYGHMSNLKTLVTLSSNMKLDFFKEFLQKNCQNLKQIHFKTVNVLFTQRGRWALEHIRSLEKVVFWNGGVGPLDRRSKYTMHRVRDNGLNG